MLYNDDAIKYSPDIDCHEANLSYSSSIAIQRYESKWQLHINR